jgi:hypothetical protein
MMKSRFVRIASARLRGPTIVAVTLGVALTGVGGGFPSAALAKEPTGPYEVFKQCPRFTPELEFCVYSQFTGDTVLGRLDMPIVNPITFQMGSQAYEFAEKAVGALGETLSTTPQPIPGGLSSLIDCGKIEGRGYLVRGERGLCEGLLRTPWARKAYATMELAEAPSEIYLSQGAESSEEGVAIRYAVKFHLENPLLGRYCYIGSNTEPIVFNFTTGETNPPPPNKPIHGIFGKFNFLEELFMIEDIGKVRVDNAFAAPAARGCGWLPGYHGPHGEALLDSLVNKTVGLPSPAGYNTAIQTGDSKETIPAAVIASEK